MTPSPDETIIVYGPRRFDRTGMLTKVTDQFTLPADAFTPFVVTVQNGDVSGSGRVLIGTVRLNGSVVFSSNDLNLQVPVLNQQVTLAAQNILEVSFFSRQVSSLTITITATKRTNPTPPAISDFNPKTGKIGTVVTLTGTNLTSNPGNPTITFAGPNTTRLPASVTSATATQVVTTVPNGAVTGVIQLTTTGGTAQTSTAFNVTPQQDFQLVVTPSTASAVQASTATLVVSVTSGQSDFTQLASLSATGLPVGVAIGFEPAQITAGGISTLSLNLNSANLAPGSYSFVISGTASVEGGTLVRSSPATLIVVAAGQTTLAGRVLNTDKQPILGATVSLDGKTATTDAAGAFILSGVTAGADRPLMVDGRTASAPNRTYPVIIEPANVVAGQANVVPYDFFLPPIDTQAEVQVVPGQMTVATNVRVPDLEMMIPAGTDLRGRDNTPVTRVSITPLPIDRTPAPLPSNVGTSVVYTSQPGGAIANAAMPVVYPNLAGADPGTRVELYAFNHNTVQWYVYGYGRVSNDGRTIVPEIDPSTGRPYGLRDFSWHFPNVSPPGKPKSFAPPPPDSAPADCDGTSGSVSQHPVDLSTGLKIEQTTDISFGGARGSITLTRIHTGDLAGACDVCPFGRGTTFNFAVRLSGSFVSGGAGRVLMPGETTGQLFSYARTDPDGSLVFNTVGTINQLGDVLKKLTNGAYEYRSKDGRVMRFDSNMRLTAMVDANANVTTLNYTGADLTSIVDAVGRSITLTYFSNHITQAVDALGRTWHYGYDGGNHLTSVTDPEGAVTSYTYDFLSRLASITDPRGNGLKVIAYDGNGRVSQQVFADGGIESYSYSLSGSIVTNATVTDPLGHKVTKQFNSNGYVISETDELGQTVKVDRDIQTNVALTTSGPCGCPEVSREFDPQGNLAQTLDRLGNKTTFQYEPIFSKVTSVTDPLNRTATMSYDTKGNVVSMTNALNQTTRFGYDAFGELTSVTDPLGHTSQFEYDAAGNLTAKVDALNDRTTFEYDAIGRRTAVIDPLGRRTRFSYDGLSRIRSISDPANKTTSISYDGNGNVTSITNALNQQYKFVYDVKNRLVSTTDPLGRTTRRQYDTDDELISITTPLGRNTTYTYDARHQMTTIKDALANTIAFTFDNKGNLSTLTDERGNQTSFIYDELSRINRRVDPLGNSTILNYDNAGNMVDKLDRLGRQVITEYDAINRPTQITYNDGVVKYSYDGAGRLARVDDTQSSPIERFYDDADRLLSEKSGAGVVAYTYNGAGQRASMTVADRIPVNYGYDSAGRLRTIVQGTETFTYSYDDLSRVVSLQRPNEVKTTYRFDTAGELTRLLHANAQNVAVEDFNYAFNADGEIESITSLASASALAAAKNATAADAGNRIAQFGQQNFVYDAEGQTTAKTEAQGSTNYQWDARGRLASATLPDGQRISYGYDAMGRRTSRSANGVSTTFVYDNLDVVRDTATNGGTVDYLNGPGIDNKLRQTSPTTGDLYFVQDHLGSTAALTTLNGSVAERMSYASFGDSIGSALTRYGYTGRERDDLTKLIYYRARWYNPQAGRFATEDPIGLRSGVNLYTYVVNNPIKRADPRGENPLLVIGLIGGVIGAVGSAWEAALDPCSSTKDVLLASLYGFAGGATTAVVTTLALETGPAALAIGAAAGNAVEQTLRGAIEGTDFSWEEYAVSVGVGSIPLGEDLISIPGARPKYLTSKVGKNAVRLVGRSAVDKTKDVVGESALKQLFHGGKASCGCQ